MSAQYKSPGIYVEELSGSRSGIIQVETAVPVFIGYSEKSSFNGQDLIAKPVLITSLAEYVQIYGKAKHTAFVTENSQGIRISRYRRQFILDSNIKDPIQQLSYRLYYSLKLYFKNGGGPCYVSSCGTYKPDNSVSISEIEAALDAAANESSITLIVFSDAVSLSDVDEYYALQQKALSQCASLRNRFLVTDVYLQHDQKGVAAFSDIGTEFREKIGLQSLSYGAAYYPWLMTSLGYYFDESMILIVRGEGVSHSDIPHGSVLRKLPLRGTASHVRNELRTSLYHHNKSLYDIIKKELDEFKVISAPSPAITGIYCKNDIVRGVWSPPANVSLMNVYGPTVLIDDIENEEMNVHITGKSVNAIRTFPGKGALVWGARTLAGNDNDWRYVPVRRFFIMVEESIKRSITFAVFEPNDENTWITLRKIIENFLTSLWKAGALSGTTTTEAFFVRVGFGDTMTEADINEGRIILEIGLAPIRPAEFTIIRMCCSSKDSQPAS